MPITPEIAKSVPGFVFPDQPVDYNRRDVILYALGIGATDLHFCYEEDPNFMPLPTLPLVLGFKGESSDIVPFGLESVNIPPGLEDVPMSSILHGEQSIEVFGRLPAEGKGLVNRSKVVAFEDKLKGALLRVETELVDTSGTVLARHCSGTFFKGMGNFGGDRGQTYAPVPLPQRPPDRAIVMPTLPCQAMLYRLSGDYNMLHIDPEFATQVGLERPILHGLCTFGFAARAVIAAACPAHPDRLRSLKGRFAAPAFPGETLVAEIWEEGGETMRLRVLARDDAKGPGSERVVLADGEARVEAPSPLARCRL